MVADISYALRGFRRAPTFTVAAALSLTLGVATSAIVFSLIDAAMFRSVPFEGADRLMLLNITQRNPREGAQYLRWSWRRFELLQQSVGSFEDLASSSNAVLTITGVDDPEPLRVEIVSPRYLLLMRAPLLAGHALSDRGRTAGEASEIVLGYDLWQRRYGGASDVIGRPLALNGVLLTIVGVVGQGFAGVSGLAEAWIPAAAAPLTSNATYLTSNQNFITVIGRLRQDVPAEAARAELEAVGRRIQAAQPSEAETPDDEFSATARTLNDARIDVVTRRALTLLGGATSVLLLIACANVASLLLGRATERRREIAIRIAIGARSGQLVRQLLIESALLAAISGALTLVVLLWALPFVRIPPTLFRGRNFYGAVGEFAMPVLDVRTVVFTAALCGVTILLFGLLPAWRASRSNAQEGLHAGGTRTITDSGMGLRELIVAFQIALALVLIVGCGLLLTSYSRLRQTSVGFDPDRLLTFMIRPSEVEYTTGAAPALIDRVLEEIARIPGVQDATVDGCAPLSMQCATAPLQIVGKPWPNPTLAPTVLRHYVAPSHFRTVGGTVLRGRGLTPEDRAGRPRVVVVNQAAAERFWPTEDPIGKRVWFDQAPNFGSPEESAEIVGVVSDVAYQPLDEAPIQPDFFTPYAQFTYPTRMVLVRTRGEPLGAVSQIAQAVRRADPDLALFDVQTMESRARLSWAKHSFQTTVLVFVGSIALLLAVTGVYAVASQMVATRTREIGVRIALGASTSQVARSSIARTVRLGLAGTSAGLVGALMVSRLLRATLYETSPLDAGAFAFAVLVLFAALTAAIYVPVRRALRVDPVTVLRGE
jgi:putative ABC transport system permease protein